MMIHRAPARQRRAFTLIEILIVIGIIALLVSLLTGAIMATLTKLDEVKTRNEISGLAQSVKQQETDFNVTIPPPSRIWLSETNDYTKPPEGYTTAQVFQPNGNLRPVFQQLMVDSQAYLKQIWPRLSYNNTAGYIDWNSDAQNQSIKDPNHPGFILEGEQCLVFFLGGARSSNGSFLGFSGSDSTNPMETTSTTKRKGPYFQFDLNRIFNMTGTPSPTSPGFAVFGDPYGKDPYGQGWKGVPYAYFSSGRGANKYNAYAFNPPWNPTLGYDCPTLGLHPYYEASSPSGSPQYYNKDTFQIISAGKDGIFGSGDAWAPTYGVAGMPTGGGDDLSNFYNAKLGILP